MRLTRLTIFLLSVSLISLELVWTRIFSAEFYYTFAFLILSLAILGLGLGALAVRIFPVLSKENHTGLFLSLTALSILVSPILVFKISLDFTQLFTSTLVIGKVLLVLLLLNSAFFFGGIVLAIIFKKHYTELPRLYMADLIGAGAGVALAVSLMNFLGTPVTVYLNAFPVLLATFLNFKKWEKSIPFFLAILMVFLSTSYIDLLEVKREERAPVIYKHWDAMSKIKILDYGKNARGINIDNAANTTVNAFDGNWDIPDSMKFGFHLTEYIINQFDTCTFLSLGAGGGQDVFQALQNGAGEIHAVEVNGHINDLLLHGNLADFSGNIYKDPRVKVITEDARAYVRRFENKFDLIYSFSSNSFAALASGAFALAENYIYTTEAFEDYWKSLSPNGFMMMEHQAYMPRLVSALIDALHNLNVQNADSHFAVYELVNIHRQMLLISKQPLSKDILENGWGDYSKIDFRYARLIYPAADSLKDNLINRMVENGWQNEQDSANVDISPTTDNRPFVAQMGLLKNLDFGKMQKISWYGDWIGIPLSKIIIMIILLVIFVIIIPINLLPYFFKGEKLKAKPWLYFFCIGMGFMIVEVVMIQKYTLLIGPSIYSIITILLTLLLSSGIGSRYARSFNNTTVFTVIVTWLIIDILLFTPLIHSAGALTLLPRILLTVLFITPLGFFMGMPFPKGGIKVGELIDWGFAVNGAASVLGSTFIILIAFNFGFHAALLTGALFYIFAYLLISKKSAW